MLQDQHCGSQRIKLCILVRLGPPFQRQAGQHTSITCVHQSPFHVGLVDSGSLSYCDSICHKWSQANSCTPCSWAAGTLRAWAGQHHIHYAVPPDPIVSNGNSCMHAKLPCRLTLTALPSLLVATTVLLDFLYTVQSSAPVQDDIGIWNKTASISSTKPALGCISAQMLHLQLSLTSTHVMTKMRGNVPCDNT